MTAQSAFWLEPKLVIEFTASRLAVRFAEVHDHLDGGVAGWLDDLPGLPRQTARLSRFVGLLDHSSTR